MSYLPDPNTDLPDATKEMIAAELASGEQLRWVGSPSPRANLLGCLVAFPVIFGFCFFAFSVFWMVMAFQGANAGGPGFLFPLFGVPFVVVGLGLVTSPLWIRRRIRKAAERTVYIITDRRAIIFDGGYYGDSGMSPFLSGMIPFIRRGSINIRSFPPAKLNQISRNQREDGSGDMLFGESFTPIPHQMLGQFDPMQQPFQRVGFFSIPNVKEVEARLQGLAASATPHTS